MAPPPEYDKEPKAPDKSATNIPSEDSKAIYNLVNEHQINSDSKSTNSSANAEVENNKHVETLDDGQLRALLDEAITYKCPKDREGKSSLFKELLEEVEQDEQDEQACSAAARVGGGRARRGGARGRRALPHSNSLQDLVAALAAEPAPRRSRHNHPPAPVSARAIHGGSLPSGVDTSFLLSEEPMRGAVGVSAVGGAEYVATVRCVNPSPLAERRVSASDAHCPDTDTLNRRSKPVFPMYTARATLEIGSGSVCSGRAVTTTTASNQVRTPAVRPQRGGYRDEGKSRVPRGPERPKPPMADGGGERNFWNDSACVEKWYRGLEAYSPVDRISGAILHSTEHFYKQDFSLQPIVDQYRNSPDRSPLKLPKTSIINTAHLNLALKNDKNIPINTSEHANEATKYSMDYHDNKPKMLDVKDVEEAMARQAYRERVGRDLVPASLSSCNPTNVRNMSIGPSWPVNFNTDNKPGTGDARDKIKDKYNRNTRNRNERNVNVNVVTDKHAAAQPADKKHVSQSKTNHRDAAKTISPRNRVASNVNLHTSTQNTFKDKSNKKLIPGENTNQLEMPTRRGKPQNTFKDTSKKDNSKTNSQNEGESKEDTDQLEMPTRKGKPQNDIELAKVLKVEEKSETNDNTKLDEIVITKEITQKDLELDEKPATKLKCHDEPKREHNPKTVESRNDTELVEMVATEENHCCDKFETKDDTNLVEMVSFHSSPDTENSNEFSLFIANQQRLLRAIGSYNYKEDQQNNESSTSPDKETSENIDRLGDQEIPNVDLRLETPFLLAAAGALDPVFEMDCCDDKDSEASGTEMVEMKRTIKSDHSPQAELPGTASYFLTLYKRLLTSACNIDNTVDIKPAGEAKPALAALDTAAKLPKKKKDKITSRLARKLHNENSNKKKDIIRNALKKLFFDNITQSDSTKLAGKGAATREVDSAIPFSCITTPEVVASCTTTASAQAAVPVDPKPARSRASAFNGVPLPRAGPAFHAAAVVAQAAAEEFKKSLDENGNSVQGFSSPQSGSSQQKKQRRKKSSKNETVIKSHHIDGYQGNKDLNEVLRFIESNEPERPKRDDKKKRSAERRKDKAPRASSLDDLSRAAPKPERPARPAQPAPNERRSWGDERPPFYYRDSNPEPDELTDFQTGIVMSQAPRASSLDDLSRAAPKPERPARPAQPAPNERRSWGDERPPFYYRDSNPEPDELTDFQTGIVMSQAPRASSLDDLSRAAPKPERPARPAQPAPNERRSWGDERPPFYYRDSNPEPDELTDFQTGIVMSQAPRASSLDDLSRAAPKPERPARPAQPAPNERRSWGDERPPFYYRDSNPEPDELTDFQTGIVMSQAPRASSLDDLSRAAPKPERPARPAQPAPNERRSWGDERPPFYYRDSNPEPDELTDFQTGIVMSQAPRASSLDDLSRAAPKPERPARPAQPAPNERRSWGDERPPFYYRDSNPEPDELTDFQTGIVMSQAPRASSLDDLSRAAPKPERPARPAQPAPNERRSWGDERPPFYYRDSNPEPDELTDFQTGIVMSQAPRASSLDDLSRAAPKPERPARPAQPAPNERRSWGDERPPFYYRDSNPEPDELTDFQTGIVMSQAPRASSLDDLSRAAPKPERPARPAQPAPNERRSWGDERPPFYYRDSNPEPDELTDFQTVTKKRKPRRRDPSPRPPEPSPRSPPSNDSNDDLDSVHSLPALPSRPALASYADIARTKHNIPDLIESCNYYEEPVVANSAPAPGDVDGYPALDPVPRRPKPAAGARARPERDSPPDVVGARPPVILLESAGLARDLDGVTFGFDIDERLLGRCDLLPAPAPAPAPAPSPAPAPAPAAAPPGVPLRAGARALRYVQPEPPRDHHHLHQIVDYVGTAWEDVVRCGNGKVRYYSE